MDSETLMPSSDGPYVDANSAYFIASIHVTMVHGYAPSVSGGIEISGRRPVAAV